MAISNEKKSADIIDVYHGSTYLFEEIDTDKGKPYKDFGLGFYVTKSRNHAISLALRNKRIEIKRHYPDCNAYLYTFGFDINEAKKFKIKEFKNADIEWLQFVISNRKIRSRSHDYDIVMGPTANDDTMAVINVYFEEMYGEIGSWDALNTLLKYIKPEVLPYQIYFGCNEAAVLLKQKGKPEVLL